MAIDDLGRRQMTFAIDAVTVLLLQYVTFAFGIAFWVHLVDRQRLESVLHRVAGISSPLATIAALTLDGVIAVGLVVVPLVGSATAVLYLTGITAYYGMKTLQGQKIPDCGCSAASKPVDSTFFGRNAILIAGAGLVVWRSMAGPLPWVWTATTLATLLLSFAVAHLQLAERAAHESGEPKDPVASSTRRAFLKAASGTLGAGAFLVTRPVQALALRRQGSSSVKRARTSLEGLEAETTINDVIDQFPALEQVERLVPGARTIEWRSATVDLVEHTRSEGKIAFTVVSAIVLGAQGPVGVLTRVAKRSAPRLSDGGTVTFEERAQLIYPSGDRQMTVFLSPDGTTTTESVEAKSAWPTIPAAGSAATCTAPLITCAPSYTANCIHMCACQHIICASRMFCAAPHPTDPWYWRQCGACDFCQDIPCPPLCGCPLGFPCCLDEFGISECDNLDCLLDLGSDCAVGDSPSA